MCAKWKKGDAEAVLESVWEGKSYAARERLFNHTASVLTEYFEEGWKSPIFTKDTMLSEDFARYQAIQRNLYKFAAAKTEKHIEELEALTQGVRPTKAEFMRGGMDVDNTFNGRTLAAEAIITRGVANAAREWQEIERTSDTFKFLQWVAVMDANTRHGFLNGLTLPWDDPRWDDLPLPLDWGCRCRRRQLRQAVPTPPEKLAEIPAQPIRPWHSNGWTSKGVWKVEQHSYHQGLSITQKEAVNATVKRAVREAKPIDIATYKKGWLKVSPFHGSTEIASNIEAGKALAKRGHKVTLRPLTEKKGQDYDAEIDDRKSEMKTPDEYTQESIIRGVREGNEQGGEIIAFHLRQRMNPDQLIKALYRAFGPKSKKDPSPRNSKITEVWLIHRGKVIKSGRWLSSEFEATINEWFKNTEGPPK